MLEIYAEVISYRGIERLFIVLSALIFGYLGYRLFIFGVDKGNSKLETESPLFKLTFSGSGPGLFFMAFGAIILIYTMLSPVEINNQVATLLANSAGPVPASTTSSTSSSSNIPMTTVTNSLKFSGALSGICDVIKFELHNTPDGVLYAYQNGLQSSRIANELAILAQTIEINIQDPLAQSAILISLEEVLCKLETS